MRGCVRWGVSKGLYQSTTLVGMQVTRFVSILSVLLFSGCTGESDRCVTFEEDYMVRAKAKIKEAIESVSDEHRQELRAAAESELALIRKNFQSACKALPKGADLGCLLSEDNGGCKEQAEVFFAAVYEDVR